MRHSYMDKINEELELRKALETVHKALIHNNDKLQTLLSKEGVRENQDIFNAAIFSGRLEVLRMICTQLQKYLDEENLKHGE